MPGRRPRSWLLRDAAAFVRRASPLAGRCGYALAMFGSTLDGVGRDLDLVAVPWGPWAERQLVEVLVESWGGRVVERLQHMGRDCAAILLPDRRVVDLQVQRPRRRTERGPR